jgi:hypothetical protein
MRVVESEGPVVSRPTLIAVLSLVVPPITGFVLVAVFLVVEAAGFSPLSSTPVTVSEAAAMGSAARALDLILRGQDPNRPSVIPVGVVDSRMYEVPAIDAAILGRHPEMIPILQQHGAVVANVRRSACLAHAIDLPEALPFLGTLRDQVKRDPSIDSSDAIQACLQSSE